MGARSRTVPVLRWCPVATLALAGAASCANGQCERWLPGGAFPGVASRGVPYQPLVEAVGTWDPDGPGPTPERLVIGGWVHAVGDVPANAVAAWDGVRWASLPGLEGQAYDLLDFGGDLMVAGSLQIPPGTASWGVVRWTGAGWEALTGLIGNATALVEYGSFLAAAGGQGVQLWNGLGWSFSIGQVQGTFPELGALAAHNGLLVAGGAFDRIGGTPAANVGAWNGTAWLPLGSGVNGRVRALETVGPDLIVGGSFTTGGGVPTDYLARWDGSQWHPMGLGETGPAVRAVEAIGVRDGRLVVGGTFLTAGGVPGTDFLAQWDGTHWSPVGAGVDGGVYALCEFGNDLIVGGRFARAGVRTAFGIARWDGETLDRVGSGADGPIFAMAEYAGRLVAGGDFLTMGDTQAAHLSAWDGIEWAAMGTGTNGPVYTLGTHAGGLVAGGAFTLADGAPASRIATWNGAGWNPLGSGVNGAVAALADRAGQLIAGGSFGVAGGGPVGRIAAWDGATWSGLGTGLNGTVYALTLHQGDLFAGGVFTQAGGAPAHRVARWDGVAWHPLGDGIASPGAIVATMESYAGDLIVAGAFTDAGGIPAGNIARWDGTRWSFLGAGMTNVGTAIDPIVNGMTVRDGRLVAVGCFNRAEAAVVGGVAEWDGASWTGLGTGLQSYASPVAHAVGALGPELVVGGDFMFAGGDPETYEGIVVANAFARWTASGAPWLARQPMPMTAYTGGGVALSVAVPPGYGPLTYQWRREGMPVVNGPGGASPGGATVAGADTSTLTLTGVRPSDAGAYTVTVANSCGQATSQPAPLSVLCYADCDGSATLTIGDFICFQTRFALGDPYADCDADGQRTVADYVCFQTRFALGC